MTDLEDRLRRDLSDYAGRVEPESVRSLQTPTVRERRLQKPRRLQPRRLQKPRRLQPRRLQRRRLQRLLAPAGAAAAVLAVVAGVSLVGPPGGLHAGVQPPAIAGLTGVAGPMPPYYVTVFQRYVAGRGVTTTAAVFDSATGKALATAPVPTLISQGGAQGPSISAAADDRTFVITELAQNGSHNGAWFFLLHVASGGRAASLTKLPITVPADLSIDDVALSPDASKLAISVQSCHGNGCQYSGIRVVTLASHAVSTWTTRVNGAPFNTSWAGNSRVVFLWDSGVRSPAPGKRTGYRLLNVAAPGRDLLAASAIGSPPAVPSGYVPAALVTSNGSVVVTSTVQNDRQWYFRDTVVAQFVELSARTGKLLGVLYTSTRKFVSPGAGGAGMLDQQCNVLSLGNVGVNVLVQCFGLGFGRLDGSKFTPLNGFPSPSSSGISGQEAAAW